MSNDASIAERTRPHVRRLVVRRYDLLRYAFLRDAADLFIFYAEDDPR